MSLILLSTYIMFSIIDVLSIIKSGKLKVEIQNADKMKDEDEEIVNDVIAPVKERVDEISKLSIQQGKMILALSSAVEALVKDAVDRKDNVQTNQRILNSVELTLKQIKNEVRQLRHRIERVQGGNDLN